MDAKTMASLAPPMLPSPYSSATSSPFDGLSPISSGISTPATEISDAFARPPSKSVLVVGGLGYIGSHTTWELLRAGYDVICVDNLSNSFRQVLDRLERLCTEHEVESRLDFHRADYRDADVMSTIIQAAASPIVGVIHFAAYKAVAESFQRPLEYYANNVAGLIDFCALLAELEIKTLIFSSSATVYGELANKGTLLTEDACDASGCTGLTNPYGRTKWMCEAILHDLAASDPSWNITALRYFNPISCDASGLLSEAPKGEPNNLMPVVVNVMLGQRSILDVFGTDWDTPNGTAVRDFIHVSDLARGHVRAIETRDHTSSSNFRVFNLGTGTGHSVQEVVTAMEDASGRSIPVRAMARRAGDVGTCVADASKALVELQWRTEKTLGDCCRDLWRSLTLARDCSAESGTA